MGYRSDVKLVITTNKKVIKADEIVGWLKGPEKEYIKVEKSRFSDIETIYYKADDIKWYDSFNEIRLFNEWLDKVDAYIEDHASVDGLGMHFVRLGENYDDIDERIVGDPMEYIQIIRYSKFEGDDYE